MNDFISRQFISRQAVLDLSIYAPIAPICVGGSIVWRHIIFKSFVEDLPSVDVQPAKRGKWILIDNDTVHGKCSECGFECHYYEDDVFGMPFCPNCGAVMSTD